MIKTNHIRASKHQSIVLSCKGFVTLWKFSSDHEKEIYLLFALEDLPEAKFTCNIIEEYEIIQC